MCLLGGKSEYHFPSRLGHHYALLRHATPNNKYIGVVHGNYEECCYKSIVSVFSCCVAEVLVNKFQMAD